MPSDPRRLRSRVRRNVLGQCRGRKYYPVGEPSADTFTFDVFRTPSRTALDQSTTTRLGGRDETESEWSPDPSRRHEATGRMEPDRRHRAGGPLPHFLYLNVPKPKVHVRALSLHPPRTWVDGRFTQATYDICHFSFCFGKFMSTRRMNYTSHLPLFYPFPTPRTLGGNTG